MNSVKTSHQEKHPEAFIPLTRNLRPMIAKSLRSLLLLAALAVSATPSRHLMAADSFHDSFEAFDTTIWGVNYANNTPPATPGNVLRIQDIDDVSYLNLRRAATGDPEPGSANAFVYYKGTSDFAPGGQIADFNLDLVIRIGEKGGSSDSMGVAFRMSTQSYSATKTGYYLGIDGSGSTARLALYQNPGNHTVGTTTPLTSSTLTGGLELDVDYILKLRAEGSTIEASLWKPNEETAIATLSISDATYLDAGYWGLRTNFTNGGTSVYYRDLTAAAIPEPSTVALASLALGGMLLLKLRHRQ